jgi:hypothetical protein
LQKLSTRVIAQTKRIEDDVDALVMESNDVDCRLQNAFNQFLMLGSVQFIENRVDDGEAALAAEAAALAAEEAQDAEAAAAAAAAKADAGGGGKAAELVSKFSSALNAGMVALDYYPSPIVDSESESSLESDDTDSESSSSGSGK